MSNLFKKLCVVSFASIMTAGTSLADAAAEKVLKKARIASTIGNQDLNGHLRKGSKKHQIALFLKGKNIQFAYLNSGKWAKFHLRLNEKGADLLEINKGKTVRFAKKKLSQSINGTDLSYEDLSMKFLYWKNSQVVGQQSIRGQKCDVVQLVNPGNDGKYHIVKAWVHKKYGSLMRVEGFNKANQRMKRFAVDKLMKVNREYTLKRMRVDTFNPATKRLIGTTYLEFSKPPRKRGLR